jgi:hypothetical protein
MIRYALNIEPPKIKPGLDYHDGIIFLGSCFSDHISQKLKERYFSVLSQTNGVVFNPISLSEPLKRIFGTGDYVDKDLVYHNGLWHSKYHHSSFSEPGKEDLLRKINHDLHEFKRYLHAARWMFITFGSAFVYEELDTNIIVANCHKIPQSKFRKRMLSVGEITETWIGLLKELKSFNPNLRIVFTVSPVKHLRDGVIENTISKSCLFMAIQAILKEDSTHLYFPAYELVNDDLRDYRFYDSDGAHPNALAIDYVYGKFCDTVFNEQTAIYAADLDRYLKMSKHRLQREDGEEYLHFMKQLESERETLKEKYDLDI